MEETSPSTDGSARVTFAIVVGVPLLSLVMMTGSLRAAPVPPRPAMTKHEAIKILRASQRAKLKEIRRALRTLERHPPLTSLGARVLIQGAGRGNKLVTAEIFSTILNLYLVKPGRNNLTLVKAAEHWLQGGHRKVVAYAVFFLRFAGTEAAPAAGRLIALMAKTRSKKLRRSVAEALGQIRPQDAKSIDALTLLVESEGVNAQIHALSASVLRRIGHAAAKRALQPLMTRLRKSTRNEETRAECVLAMGFMDNTTNPVVKTLIKAMKDPSKRVRGAAAKAMIVLRPQTDVALEDLRKLLGENDSHIRALAVAVLGSSFNFGRKTMDELLTLVKKDPDLTVRLNAADALGVLGQSARRLALTLLKIMRNAAPKLRDRIGKALIRISPNAQVHITELISLLGDSSGALRLRALAILRVVGVEAKRALPKIAKLLREDRDPKVRAKAAKTLRVFGSLARPYHGELIGALTAKEKSVWKSAESSLLKIRPTSKDAVGKLMLLLTNDTVHVRHAAIKVLGEIGAAAGTAIDALKAQLGGEKERQLKLAIIRALAKTSGTSAKAVPALIVAVRSEDKGLSVAAIVALGVIGRPAAVALDQLFRSVRGDSAAVCKAAARAIGLIRPQNPAKAVDHLVKALEHRDPEVQKEAAEALSRFGVSASRATKALLQIASNERSDFALRSYAINALARIGVQSEEFVRLLKQLLSRRDWVKLRRIVAKMLTLMIPLPPGIVEDLRRVAKEDIDPKVRRYATQALGNAESSDEKTIEILRSILEDTGLVQRIAAARSLENLGAGAELALDALLKILGKGTESVRLRRHVARAIGRVATDRCDDAAKALLKVVLSKDADLSLRRESLASLHNLPTQYARFSDPLAQMLHHPDFYLRKYVLWILGGYGSLKSMDPLLGLVKRDPHPLLVTGAILAIGEIAERARVQLPSRVLPLLRKAKGQLENLCTPETCSKKRIDAVDKTMKTINAAIKEKVQSGESFWSRAFDTVRKYPKAAGVVAYLVVVGLLSLLLFVLYPYAIYVLNERTRKIDFKLPTWLGGFTVPARFLLIVGLFSQANRVVDAWVAKHIKLVSPRFNKYRLVAYRLRYATIQVQFEEDGVQPQDPNVLVLQSKFAGQRTLAMVHGEGGSGKTTFSIRLAQLAMMERNELRLCPDRRMIPVLLQNNLEPQTAQGLSGTELIAEVAHQLQRLTGTQRPESSAFVRQLLASGRVMLIVDGYSEKSQESRRIVHEQIGVARTAIITSRRKERDFEVEGMGIRMLRIRRQFLISVMNVYLTDSTGEVVITDKEIYNACRNLANLVGKRDVTPLLVRLYAEHLKSQAQGQQGRDRPRNVPELMLGYLNELNAVVQSDRQDDTTVQRAAKIVAWKCLETDLSPRSTRKSVALEALREHEADEALLKYLEETLMIVETVGVEKNRYLFTMDPVAEYLAALYMVEEYGNDEAKWSAFLSKADGLKADGLPIEEYIAAVEEVIKARDTNLSLAPNVVPQLRRLSRIKAPDGEVNEEDEADDDSASSDGE